MKILRHASTFKPCTPMPLGRRASSSTGGGFDQFVCAPAHQPVLRFCQRFASPDPVFRTLALVGPHGVGKTLLLRSMKRAYDLHAQVPAQFISAREITDQNFVSRGDDKTKFLLLDDEESLARMMSIEKRCFSMWLQEFLGREGRIAISISSCNAERLRFPIWDRFSSELVCFSIEPIEQSQRLDFVRALAMKMDLAIDDPLLQEIANSPINIPADLRGILNKVEFQTKILHEPVTVEEFHRWLKDVVPLLRLNQEREQISAIINAICTHYGLTMKSLAGSARDRNISEARHLASFFLRMAANLPYSKIGQLLGGRRASTILLEVRRIREQIAASIVTARTFEALRDTLGLGPFGNQSLDRPDSV